MSLITTKGTLAAALATNGTLVIGYPNDPDTGVASTLGDFTDGVNFKFVVGSNGYSAPNDFSLAFAATTITLTYLGASTLPVGAQWFLTLDRPGIDANVAGLNDRNAYTSSLAAKTALVKPRNCFPVPNLTMVDMGSPVAAAAAGLRAAAAIGAAGALVLLATALDVPRQILFTTASTETGLVLTISSVDYYGNVVTDNVTINAVAGTFASNKTHLGAITVTADRASVGTVAIGTNSVLGLPVWLPNAGFVLIEMVDGAKVTTGTFVAGVSVQTKSTATTADVRGTYLPATAVNGAHSYQIYCLLPDPLFIGNPQF